MEKFSINKLNAIITETLIVNGVCPEQAKIISDCMIMADACGVHSHGLNVLPAYIKKIENKSFNVSGNPLIIKETSAFTLLDSNNLIGMYSAWFCMDVAIKKCQENGIHYVSSRNCNTFGPAFYYTRYAAERGMIGICFSNSPSAMPAWGGKKKILGTNPFSVAIPSKTKGIIILDMASSIVAKSKINELRKEGKEKVAELIKELHGKEYKNQTVELMLQSLVEELKIHKGKKVYGYLRPKAKNIVNGIVDEIAKDERIAKLYELWYQQQEEIVKTYQDKKEKRVPLSSNEEFKSIRNAVVKEAVNLLTSEYAEKKQAWQSQQKWMIKRSSIRLFHQLGKIFQEKLEKNKTGRGQTESKLRRMIDEKKRAHGIRQE